MVNWLQKEKIKDKKEEKKIDTKGNIKLEGVVVPKMAAASASPARATRGRGKKRAASSGSDIEIGEFKPNRTRDMTFWEQQSARELRNQLYLRNPSRVRDWAFKTKQQLLDIFRARTAGADW